MPEPIRLSDYIPPGFPLGKAIGAFFGVVFLIVLFSTASYTVPAESEAVAACSAIPFLPPVPAMASCLHRDS